MENAIILIHTKADIEGLKNYRLILLLSIVYKLFTKIGNRIKTLEFHQSNDLAGFCSGYSTIDHIQTTNQVMKKCVEYNQFL